MRLFKNTKIPTAIPPTAKKPNPQPTSGDLSVSELLGVEVSNTSFGEGIPPEVSFGVGDNGSEVGFSDEIAVSFVGSTSVADSGVAFVTKVASSGFGGRNLFLRQGWYRCSGRNWRLQGGSWLDLYRPRVSQPSNKCILRTI